jgi:hypothetical protein
MGIMWIWDNWTKSDRRSITFRLLFGWNILLILCGTFCMVAGTWASVVAIHQDLKSNSTVS